MTSEPLQIWHTAPLATSLLIVLAVLLLTAAIWGLVVLTRKGLHSLRTSTSSGSGAGLFYLVATMSTAVSANTSWRFFGHQLGITATAERLAMFAVLEVAFIACAYAMRANVRTRTDGQPGAPRMVAWLLTIVASYMAITESGLWSGIARVALGPALGIVALHLALGIELRQSNADTTGTLGRIAHELRERGLSRLGLADDHRNALARTQDRAARRAARLAKANRAWFRDQRLQRALERSNVAHDATVRTRMLDELAMLEHAHALATLAQPSPWVNLERPDVSRAGTPSTKPEPTALPDPTNPNLGQDTVGTDPTSTSTSTNHSDHPTTAQAEVPALDPTTAGAATEDDHRADAESDHGRTPPTAGDDGTQVLPVAVAAETSKPQASAQSDEPVGHTDHSRTTGLTQHLAPVHRANGDHTHAPVPAESDHRGRALSTTPEPWSGESEIPATKAVTHHDEPDHSRTPDDTASGRYGTRLPTKGLSQADVAHALAPIADALLQEDDFLSREDVKAVTEITSSQTANDVLALIRTGVSEHTSELPKPRSRRRDRERTIRLALSRIVQQPHIHAVQ